jgi:hypothetical protein
MASHTRSLILGMQAVAIEETFSRSFSIYSANTVVGRVPSQHPLRTNVRISNELMASLECSHLTGVAHLDGMNKNLACDKIE